MGSVAVFCPNCKIAYSDARCSGCGGNLEDYAPLYHMVCAAYNRSLQLAKEGKSERAWADLATIIPAFPFVGQALHLLFELSLTLREYSTAAHSAAWMSALGAAFDEEQLRLRVTEAVEEDPSGIDSPNRDVGNSVPTVATSADWRRNRLAMVVLVVLGLAVSVSAVIFGVSASRRERALAAELGAATALHSDQYARHHATVDSLQAIVLALSERGESRLNDIKPEGSAWRDRIESLGPHSLYRLLGLNDPSSKSRVADMAAFVELHPDYRSYTGPFLRELYDEFKTKDPARAYSYAQLLERYCQEHAPLARILITAEIRQLLDQEVPDE